MIENVRGYFDKNIEEMRKQTGSAEKLYTRIKADFSYLDADIIDDIMFRHGYTREKNYFGVVAWKDPVSDTSQSSSSNPLTR